MFMQMPFPGPHGSDSHSFTSERTGRPGGDIKGRLRAPAIPWTTRPTPPPTVPLTNAVAVLRM